jgi:FlaA1/EpsC-like NDP-sugar epimerase
MILKWILKRCKCKSTCVFSDDEYNFQHLNRRLTEYTLKQKDVQRILRILDKRELKSEDI